MRRALLASLVSVLVLDACTGGTGTSGPSTIDGISDVNTVAR